MEEEIKATDESRTGCHSRSHYKTSCQLCPVAYSISQDVESHSPANVQNSALAQTHGRHALVPT